MPYEKGGQDMSTRGGCEFSQTERNVKAIFVEGYRNIEVVREKAK